jgi:transcriptional regulator with XRE-family HTH domain
MTPAQCRMARAALGWGTIKLAKAAGVGISTVTRFENGQSQPRQETILAIRRTLEEAGVIFLSEGETREGGLGVRFGGTHSAS